MVSDVLLRKKKLVASPVKEFSLPLLISDYYCHFICCQTVPQHPAALDQCFVTTISE